MFTDRANHDCELIELFPVDAPFDDHRCITEICVRVWISYRDPSTHQHRDLHWTKICFCCAVGVDLTVRTDRARHDFEPRERSPLVMRQLMLIDVPLTSVFGFLVRSLSDS